MRFALPLLAIIGACGGGPATTTAPTSAGTESGGAGDPEARFGPLEVGADYASYTRLTDKPFLSLDHGNRWVEVYVNEVGRAAYEDAAEIPVGTVLVKTSWLDDDGTPSAIAGPIFVMQKRAPGYAPEHGDWWYAIHWANPPATSARASGGPIYWRGRSQRAAYCYDCHDSYDRSLGGLIPSSILKR
ncbi:MAG: cytochrome P460 family protein [Myxococcota bacterium]|nr:cytochrome P460 family protein [Myxococcota bacterium]